MKNIEVTYTAQVLENGKCEEGEAAFILPMTDGLSECYLTLLYIMIHVLVDERWCVWIVF